MMLFLFTHIAIPLWIRIMQIVIRLWVRVYSRCPRCGVMDHGRSV